MGIKEVVIVSIERSGDKGSSIQSLLRGVEIQEVVIQSLLRGVGIKEVVYSLY